MNRHSLLVISALAFASCQSSPSYAPPRLVGDDMFAVNFHGRLSTAPQPLLPETLLPKTLAQPVATRTAADERDAAVACSNTEEIRVAMQVVSVPRAWVQATFGVRAHLKDARPSGPQARAHNAQLILPQQQPAAQKVVSPSPLPLLARLPIMTFLFEGSDASIPVQWWGPRGMRVVADEARPIFAELRDRQERRKTKSRDFAHDLMFTCTPDQEAQVSVASQVAFVESFEFADRDNSLTWEPGISTAETGFALKLLPKVDADGLLLDYRLQVRDVAGMPTAESRIADSYRHGNLAKTKPVTLQAPIFSDHVFEGQRRCRDHDAFLVYATNATAEDEVILALFEVQRDLSKPPVASGLPE